MTLKEIWNNRSWRFTFWLTAALLAYRTAPDTGVPLGISVLTGLIYVVMWVLLVHLDAGVSEKPVSPLLVFMALLMIFAAVTLAFAGEGAGLLLTVALMWLVPVGMPLQGLVRLASAGASRSDGAMAVVTLVFLAVMAAAWFVLYRRKKGRGEAK